MNGAQNEVQDVWQSEALPMIVEAAPPTSNREVLLEFIASNERTIHKDIRKSEGTN